VVVVVVEVVVAVVVVVVVVVVALITLSCKPLKFRSNKKSLPADNPLLFLSCVHLLSK